MVKSHHIAKNIFSVLPKVEDQFTDIPAPYANGEGNYCSAGGKYMAVHRKAAGGPCLILKLDETGRCKAERTTIATHKGKVLDSEWNPFNDDIIATASEDTEVHLTRIPVEMYDGSDFEPVRDPVQVLKGHQKKVALCTFNPTVDFCLLSASYDRSCKVWDVATAQAYKTYETEANISSIKWNSDGSLFAMCSGTSKANSVCTVWDPRQDSPAFEIALPGHSKVFWADGLNYIGFTSKDGSPPKKSIRVYDMANLDADRKRGIWRHKGTESASKPEQCHYDPDHDLLMTYGKGEVSLSIYSLSSDKGINLLNRDVKNPGQKGGCFIPKRACDISTTEVFRFMKLTDKAVIPLSYTIPRKVMDKFHDDIYPDTYAGKASCSFAEYLNGTDPALIMGSMNPENENWVGYRDGVEFVRKKTYEELEAENAALRARVADLEQQLGIEPEEVAAQAE